MTTVVILQSNYIPWKGYFHLMQVADRFIFHDDLQYTHSDWRNRNQIIGPNGPLWLSIPAGRDEKRLICEVEVSDQSWKKKHRNLVEQHYLKAPFFEEYEGLLDFLYANDLTNLAEYNQRAIRHLASLLNIKTQIDDSRNYKLVGNKTDRLIELLQKVKATRYLSGPAGRNYLEQDAFDRAGIELSYFEYPDYPTYTQQYSNRVYNVSILDMLFNLGPETGHYIWFS